MMYVTFCARVRYGTTVPGGMVVWP